MQTALDSTESSCTAARLSDLYKAWLCLILCLNTSTEPQGLAAKPGICAEAEHHTEPLSNFKHTVSHRSHGQ